MGLLGRHSRMAVTVGIASALFAMTAEAPAWAATTTVPDRTFPANAATLADVATSIRAEAAYSAGYTGKGIGIALIDTGVVPRSEEHTSELQSRRDLVCRLLLEKK